MNQLQPYADIVDKLRNYSLQIEWLHIQLPWEQLVTWATIIVLGCLAWWMARYVSKNL